MKFQFNETSFWDDVEDVAIQAFHVLIDKLSADGRNRVGELVDTISLLTRIGKRITKHASDDDSKLLVAFVVGMAVQLKIVLLSDLCASDKLKVLYAATLRFLKEVYEVVVKR